MTRHRIDSFQRKIKPLEYRGNNRTVKIECTMHSDSGHITFIGEVKEFDIRVRDKDVEKVYQECCRLLDEKTAIEWVPHMAISVSSGVNKKFVRPEDEGYTNASGFAIHLDIECEHIEIGTKPDKTKVTRTHGSHISPGMPTVGRGTRGYMVNKFDLDTLDALIIDTPQNREALLLLAIEFERLYAKLDEMLDPKTIQKTLTAATAAGLLMPAPASVEKKRKR